MATPAYLVGNVVAVSHDGDLLYATRGDLTRQVNVVTVTNARSGGYREVRPGNKSADINVECVYNGDDPKDITEGEEVEIVWTPTGGTARTMTALIASAVETFEVDGSYVYRFTAQSSGSYT